MDRIGPYKVVRRLTSEGTGELYEAVHEQIQRRASIKVLHKELAEDRAAVTRFLNEAKAVNLISHPSIVTIYEQGQLDSGAPYIVMEYLEGETLRDRLRRLGRPMDPAKAMRTARQLASALSAAHANQVVHRDLKPSKIPSVEERSFRFPMPSTTLGKPSLDPSWHYLKFPSRNRSEEPRSAWRPPGAASWP